MIYFKITIFSGHVAVGLFAKSDKEDNDLYGRDLSSKGSRKNKFIFLVVRPLRP